MQQFTRTVDSQSFGAKGSVKGCSSRFPTAQTGNCNQNKPTNFTGNEMWLTTLIKKKKKKNWKKSIFISMCRININKYEFTRYFKRIKQNPKMCSKTPIIFINAWTSTEEISRFTVFSCVDHLNGVDIWWQYSCLMFRSFGSAWNPAPSCCSLHRAEDQTVGQMSEDLWCNL